MKKNLFLLISLILIGFSLSAQEKYFTNQPSFFYSDTLKTQIMGSIPENEKVNVLKTLEGFYRIKYKGYRGYVEKSNITVGEEQALLQPIQKPLVEITPDQRQELLKENISRLDRYNRKHRKALNATYFLLGGSALFSGIGSGLMAVSEDYFSYVFLGLGSVCGVGALVSEICAMEFQATINKTNLKIQYLGNGMKISF